MHEWYISPLDEGGSRFLQVLFPDAPNSKKELYVNGAARDCYPCELHDIATALSSLPSCSFLVLRKRWGFPDESLRPVRENELQGAINRFYRPTKALKALA